MRCRGITLLELIITVAIIAILASIAYPSFQAHMLKSRRAEALEHLLSAQLKIEEQRVITGGYQKPASFSTDSEWKASIFGQIKMEDLYEYSISGANATTYELAATAKSGSPQTHDSGCTSLSITNNESNGKLPVDCWK